MEGITRRDLDHIVRILTSDVKTDEAKKLAGIIRDYDIIPKLYAYTYFKKVFQELQGGLEETFDDFEPKIENMEGLQLEYINKNNFKAFKEMFKIGFDRENYICDFDDSRNKGSKFGVCEAEQHSENYDEDEIDKKQELTLVLMPDEFNRKYDDKSAEYWCASCCEEAEPDVEVSCDMDIES